ncbi:hypothetical protein GCM10027440_17250 [Nocardiopsis coralliicola]
MNGAPGRAPGRWGCSQPGSGAALAGVSVSLPSMRYDPERLPALVATLQAAAESLGRDMAGGPRT